MVRKTHAVTLLYLLLIQKFCLLFAFFSSARIALHYDDEVFKDFSWNRHFSDLCKQLLQYEKPTVAQSMYIFKPPKLGAKVPPHQDSTFLFMHKKPCIGFWFALEDATIENGCLWAWAGSHKLGLKRRFVRATGGENNEVAKMKFVPYNEEMDQTIDNEEVHKDKYQAVEVPAGSLVVLHGQMLHKSYDNESDKSRAAYTFHCIDMNADYPNDNWLLRKDNFPTCWHD